MLCINHDEPTNADNGSQSHEEKSSTASAKKYLKYISPVEANAILMSLKKPKIMTSKKETFMKTFKMFQICFARHCALLSCVPSASRSEITVKGLSNILEEIIFKADLKIGDALLGALHF